MHTLKTLLDSAKASHDGSYEPVIFDLSKKADVVKFEKLLASGAVATVSDDYIEQLRELFGIQNPAIVYGGNFEASFQAYLAALQKKTPLHAHGKWAYFPWRSNVSHILSHDEFFTVRTGRNMNLITSQEQKLYYDAVVGIGGLSVGSSVALAIVLQGGARRIKLADLDRLALSNTNRIRAGVTDLGLLKVESTARQIYEINPYAQVEIFSDGLTEKNIDRFFGGSHPLDVMIDEMDNLAIKFLIREHARKLRIPVLMAADNGDNGVVDVERYDLNPKTKFFHGRMGNVTFDELKKLDKFGIGKMITKHVGVDNVTVRMQQSLLEMGKTVVSWPQLGGAAMMNGAAVAYALRKVVTKQPLINNRALVSLDEKLDASYHSKSSIAKRKAAGDSFRKIFGL